MLPAWATARRAPVTRAARERRKVAVLGGGPAAITAAFQLTAPEQGDRFDVTVYQPGWRLGGKCASGRNLDPDKGKRIEEHGLHVWFGFYENAFRVMRDAYEELNRPPDHPLATLEEAFKGCNQVILYDRQGSGWERLVLNVPTNALAPGEQVDLPHFWDIAGRMCHWAMQHLEGLRKDKPDAFAGLAPQARLSPGWFRNALGAVGAGAGVFSLPGGENLLLAARHLAHTRSVLVTHSIPCPPLPPHPILAMAGPSSPEQLLVWLLRRFRDWLWQNVVRHRVEDDAQLRFFFTVLDTIACATAGIVEDGVLEHGWDAINDYDLCQWLTRHGAMQVTVGATPAERSPMLRAIYDVAFGYPEGVIEKANIAAGTAMSDLLRLAFTYRGSLMYKMQAGMGDTVFTPFYQVLRARGVKFKFFHTVTDLRLSADGSQVEQISVIPQVQLAGASYDPLVKVNRLECWPNEPDWTQLGDGAQLKRRGIDFEGEANPLERDPETLLRGEDFDSVVLGIPVGALPAICGEIAKRHPPFATMLSFASTVRTQAFQLWLGKRPEQLGWPGSQDSVAGCYVEPLDTWCDMTHLLPREAWRSSDGVRGIAYFCGVLDDRAGEGATAATDRVKENAMAFLASQIAPIWPLGVGRVGAIDWSLLADPGGSRRGRARFAAQFWHANTTPSERYVLTPAGSVKHRLAADASCVENLVLAGDWTRNGIDGGCVESAVLSGLQAARALTGDAGPLIGESPTWLTDRRAARSGLLGSLLGLRRCAAAAPAPARRPSYVEFGARQTTPPPFSCTEGSFQGLLLKGDRARIADLCQRTLNDPAAGAVEYRPLLDSHVLMLTGSFGRITSQAQGFQSWGYIDEAQVSLWIPLIAGRSVAGLFIPERLCMTVPFIVVDNPMSCAGGREVYGYPKSLGMFDPAAGVGDPLTVKVFGGDFSKRDEASWKTLFEIARAKGAAASPSGTKAAKRAVRRNAWRKPEAIVDHFKSSVAKDWDVMPDLTLLDDVITALVKKEARQVFLKQFRDVAVPGRACYQAVVEAPIHVTSASWRPSFDAWHVTVNEWDSHPVVAETGVCTQDAAFTFELNMDMIAEPGVVVAPRS
jgi:uncharacterized protein with NAD-binding domain and iron-sulfur cluster